MKPPARVRRGRDTAGAAHAAPRVSGNRIRRRMYAMSNRMGMVPGSQA